MANSVQRRLEKELERLKEMFGLDPRLTVIWTPLTESVLSGEVKNGRVHIYEVEVYKAIQILRHETIDFLISSAIEPYRKIANEMISFVNEEAYHRKDRIVDHLIKWVKWDTKETEKTRDRMEGGE